MKNDIVDKVLDTDIGLFVAFYGLIGLVGGYMLFMIVMALWGGVMFIGGIAGLLKFGISQL